MALKVKYTKREDIPKGAEEHYVEKDGAWVLDADYEDVTALRNAKEHEKKDRQKAEARVKELERELEERVGELNGLREGAIPKGDVEALKKSYQGKYEKDIGERDSRIQKLNAVVNKNIREAAARALASEIFTSPAVGLPHVLERLVIEESGDDFVVRVKDKDGTVGAATMDDLKKELLQNKDFAAILIGSRASGGGAQGGQGGGGAPNGGKPFDAASASPSELVAHLKAKKEAGA